MQFGIRNYWRVRVNYDSTDLLKAIEILRKILLLSIFFVNNILIKHGLLSSCKTTNKAQWLGIFWLYNELAETFNNYFFIITNNISGKNHSSVV